MEVRLTRRFVSYLRVSTERQGQSGLGLAAQRAAVSEFIAPQDSLLAEFVEVESGKVSHRPELQRAIAEAKTHQATLLIAKLDRLARNVAFIAHLLEAGIELVAVDMPDANRFMLHIMAAVAEQEARACSERTKAALAAAKARGVRLGWSNPKRKAEQKRASAKGAAANKRNTQAFMEGMIPMVRECLRHGHRTPTAVAQYLNKQGVQARRGGVWHPSSAANLLKAVETQEVILNGNH